MRSTPIAVYGHKLSKQELMTIIKDDCHFTHCNKNVIDVVYLYCLAIGQLINKADRADRAALAFAEVVQACKEHPNGEVQDWLELAYKFKNDGRWNTYELDPSKQ